MTTKYHYVIIVQCFLRNVHVCFYNSIVNRSGQEWWQDNITTSPWRLSIFRWLLCTYLIPTAIDYLIVALSEISSIKSPHTTAMMMMMMMMMKMMILFIILSPKLPGICDVECCGVAFLILLPRPLSILK